MKKKIFIKKKGFTLLELLAVIVVLAIILLIAIPIVLNVIEDSRKGAFESSAYGLIKTAENECLTARLARGERTRLLTFPEAEDDLYFSGEGPDGGQIRVHNNCRVEIAIHKGKWCARKSVDENEVTLTPYDGDCNLEEVWVYPDPEEWTADDYFEWEMSEEGAIIVAFHPFGVGGSLPENRDPIIPEVYNGEPVIGLGVSEYWDNNKEQYLTLAEKTFLENTWAFLKQAQVQKVSAAAGPPPPVASGPFADKEVVTVMIPNTVLYIGEGAFKNNNITNLVISPSVKVIDYDAFENCNLETISFANGLKYIGRKSFINNSILNLTLPTSLEHIGERAFENNEILNLTLSTSLEHIGERAFEDNEIEELTLPASLEYIGSGAFGYNNIESLELPNNLQTLGGYAFAYNQISEVTYNQNNIDYVPEGIFSHNEITKVVIGAGIERIHEGAFNHNNIDDLTLPEGLRDIDVRAFANNNLSELELPEGLKKLSFNSSSLSGGAFYNNELETIYFSSTITYIGRGTFAGNVQSITVISNHPIITTSTDCSFLQTLDLGFAPTGCNQSGGEWSGWASSSGFYIPLIDLRAFSDNNVYGFGNFRGRYEGEGTYTSTDGGGTWTKE